MTLLILGSTMRLAVGVDCWESISTESISGLFSTRWDIQWGPADVQPLVLSPKAWIWMPRLALGSLPVMFHETVTGEFSSGCSKVTVPETLESPRRTATGAIVSPSCPNLQRIQLPSPASLQSTAWPLSRIKPFDPKRGKENHGGPADTAS